MDLQLKSYKTVLEKCNTMLEVTDYIYNNYKDLMDDDENINHYMKEKYSLIELQIMELSNNVEGLFTDLNAHLMNNINNYQAKINKKIKEIKEKKRLVKMSLALILHNHMLSDKDSIYYSLTNKEKCDCEINKLKEEFGL